MKKLIAILCILCSVSALGNSTHQESWAEYPAGDHPESLISADLNADGFSDLISVANGNQALMVLINRGDGTFSSPVKVQMTGSSQEKVDPLDIFVDDFNGDRRPDALVTHMLGRIQSFVGEGSIEKPFYEGRTVFTGAGGVTNPVSGDFLKPGSKSIAVVSGDWDEDPQVWLLKSRGADQFEVESRPIISSAVLADLTFSHPVDVNKDGFTDLLVISQHMKKIYLLINREGKGFEVSQAIATGKMPYSLNVIQTADNSSYLMAVGHMSTNAVHLHSWNKSKSQFESLPPVTVWAATTAVNLVRVALANGQRGLALLALSFDGDQLVVFPGDESGLFNEKNKIVYPTGHNPNALVVEDFNKDGVDDFAVLSWKKGTVQIIQNGSYRGSSEKTGP